MNKKLSTLLEEYKKVDLQIAILAKQKDLLKTQVKNRLEEQNLDSFEENGYKATKFETTRLMYIKAELEKAIDPAILKKCSKSITSQMLKITYEK
jgi:hypothetical protein